jgi:hypothetical protein
MRPEGLKRGRVILEDCDPGRPGWLTTQKTQGLAHQGSFNQAAVVRMNEQLQAMVASPEDHSYRHHGHQSSLCQSHQAIDPAPTQVSQGL